MSLGLVVAEVLIALGFTYINGFHPVRPCCWRR
jgi:hypothetical protein